MVKMNLDFRSAIPEDARQCVTLRGNTRQNAYSVEALAAIGITQTTWSDGIADGSSPGHVCLHNQAIVGMCFYDNASGEVLVVAVLPGFEGQGIGEKLLQLTLAELKATGHTRSFLGCNPSPSSRSHGFYRHLGWRPTGETDTNGDEVLELIL